MDILEYSSSQYWQNMQIQERRSKVFTKPWISLEFLESAWILGFSGKSLLREREVEIYFLKLTLP